MSKSLHITDGATFKYFYLGLLGVVISILFITSESLQIVGIITLPVSIFVFLSIRGSIIDFKQKRFKPYWNIVFIKIGKWETLDKFSRVELLLNSQSQTMNYRSVSNTIQVRSYYISLTNDKKERLELKEFTDYKKAKKMLNDLGKKLNYQTVDRLELLQRK